MPSFKKETVINAAPDRVFSYITDFSRHPEWATHKLRIEPASEGAVAVGSKFTSVGHMMGADSQDQVTVTDYAPPQRFAFESTNKGGRFRHTFELRPDANGTRLSKQFDFVETAFMTKLMMPVISLLAPKIVTTDLKRIKEHVE